MPIFIKTNPHYRFETSAFITTIHMPIFITTNPHDQDDDHPQAGEATPRSCPSTVLEDDNEAHHTTSVCSRLLSKAVFA
jgi:hypothetical protein